MMQWIKLTSIFKKEVRRFFRILGQAVFMPMVTTSLYLLIFGVGLGNQIHVVQGVPYLKFLVPGLIMMSVINNSFLNGSMSLLISKVYGDIEDLKTAPLSVNTIVLGVSLASTFRGVLVAFAVFLVGEVFMYSQFHSLFLPQHMGVFLLLIFLGGLTFSFLGFSAGIMAKSFEFLNSMSQFVILPLVYLGGVFFTLNTLHPFWQKIAQFNPIFYYINGIRYAFLGVSDSSIKEILLILLFFLFVSFILARYAAKNGSYKHL